MRTEPAARAIQRMRQDGLRPVLRRAVEEVVPRIWLHEVHVWYVIRLDQERPRPPLPQGCTLQRATADDLPLLEQLPEPDVTGARRRMAEGHELWLVMEDGRPKFRVWTFYGEAPVYAARGGVLPLRPDVVNLEDAMTAHEARGRGLAASGYAAVFDVIATDGRGPTVIGKPPRDNVANRRAMEKAGFTAVAEMTFRRTGPRQQVRVVPFGESIEAWLAASLMR